MRTPLLPSSAHLQGIWNILEYHPLMMVILEPHGTTTNPLSTFEFSTILKQLNETTSTTNQPCRAKATCRCSRLVFPVGVTGFVRWQLTTSRIDIELLAAQLHEGIPGSYRVHCLRNTTVGWLMDDGLGGHFIGIIWDQLWDTMG